MAPIPPTTPSLAAPPPSPYLPRRMDPLVLGLTIGGLGGLALTGLVALVAYRRTSRLQQRAYHAERLAELGALTGGLAHELKNPLSTVQLNLQLLREDLNPRDLGEPQYSRLINRLG